MRLTIVGAGYVGLVSGACFAEFGHEVICVDEDESKIEVLKNGKLPIFEPGLDQLVGNNVSAGRLRFTRDLAGSVADSDIVFIAVGTPSRHGDGFADLSFVFDAVDNIAKSLRGDTIVAIKSTVPVGTGARVSARLRDQLSKRGCEAGVEVVSNPEFLREGSAIEDFMRPDRIVVGALSGFGHDQFVRLYKPLSLRNVPMILTTLETAELTKYAGNAFLAAKITFINEIADLCEQVGADVQEVARGIGLDGRIGGKFLHAGPGFGGSCFPKDIRALLGVAEDASVSLSLVDAVMRANESRKAGMADRVVAACGGSVAGKTIAVLGLTFKPNTDDMRESPSLTLIPALLAAGAHIKAYDPKGMDEAKRLLPDIEYCANAYDAVEGCDSAVIVTEWNEFRALDLQRTMALMREPVIVDLRNIYQSAEMVQAGFTYYSIGRGAAG